VSISCLFERQPLFENGDVEMNDDGYLTPGVFEEYMKELRGKGWSSRGCQNGNIDGVLRFGQCDGVEEKVVVKKSRMVEVDSVILLNSSS